MGNSNLTLQEIKSIAAALLMPPIDLIEFIKNRDVNLLESARAIADPCKTYQDLSRQRLAIDAFKLNKTIQEVETMDEYDRILESAQVSYVLYKNRKCNYESLPA